MRIPRTVNSPAMEPMWRYIEKYSATVRTYTGTTTTGGAATIPHGVLNGHQTVLWVQGYYDGTSHVATPMAVTAIDATNINMTSGAVSKGYRVTAAFADQPGGW